MVWETDNEQQMLLEVAFQVLQIFAASIFLHKILYPSPGCLWKIKLKLLIHKVQYHHGKW